MAEKKQTVKKTEKVEKKKQVKEKAVKPAKEVKKERPAKEVKEKKTEKAKPAKTEKKVVEKPARKEEKVGISNKVLQMVPLLTEKAVMMIESQNVLTFKLARSATKQEIKREVQEVFDVKPIKIRVNNRGSKKYAYVKLNPKEPAIDIATKLGMI